MKIIAKATAMFDGPEDEISDGFGEFEPVEFSWSSCGDSKVWWVLVAMILVLLYS